VNPGWRPVVSLSGGKVVGGCLLEILATELPTRAGAPGWGMPAFGTCYTTYLCIYIRIYMLAVGCSSDLHCCKGGSVCPSKV